MKITKEDLLLNTSQQNRTRPRNLAETGFADSTTAGNKAQMKTTYPVK